MKKTLLTLTTALTLPATAALADGPKMQFYAGAQAGGTTSWTNFTTDSRDAAAAAGQTDVQIKHNKNDTFGIAGVFTGLRFFFGNFFTGLEVEGNWDGMNIKVKSLHPSIGEPWRIELKRRYQFTPSATLGWKMNEKTALYAKFGAGFSKFDLSFNRHDVDSTSKTTTVVHFVPALGAEYELHENFALRADVSAEIAGRHIKGNSVVNANISQATKVRYRSVSAKFGVLVKV